MYFKKWKIMLLNNQDYRLYSWWDYTSVAYKNSSLLNSLLLFLILIDPQPFIYILHNYLFIFLFQLLIFFFSTDYQIIVKYITSLHGMNLIDQSRYRRLLNFLFLYFFIIKLKIQVHCTLIPLENYWKPKQIHSVPWMFNLLLFFFPLSLSLFLFVANSAFNQVQCHYINLAHLYSLYTNIDLNLFQLTNENYICKNTFAVILCVDWKINSR